MTLVLPLLRRSLGSSLFLTPSSPGCSVGSRRSGCLQWTRGYPPQVPRPVTRPVPGCLGAALCHKESPSQAYTPPKRQAVANGGLIGESKAQHLSFFFSFFSTGEILKSRPSSKLPMELTESAMETTFEVIFSFSFFSFFSFLLLLPLRLPVLLVVLLLSSLSLSLSLPYFSSLLSPPILPFSPFFFFFFSDRCFSRKYSPVNLDEILHLTACVQGTRSKPIAPGEILGSRLNSGSGTIKMITVLSPGLCSFTFLGTKETEHSTDYQISLPSR